MHVQGECGRHSQRLGCDHASPSVLCVKRYSWSQWLCTTALFVNGGWAVAGGEAGLCNYQDTMRLICSDTPCFLLLFFTDWISKAHRRHILSRDSGKMLWNVSSMANQKTPLPGVLLTQHCWLPGLWSGPSLCPIYRARTVYEHLIHLEHTEWRAWAPWGAVCWIWLVADRTFNTDVELMSKHFIQVNVVMRSTFG